jgi:hypothetical protein
LKFEKLLGVNILELKICLVLGQFKGRGCSQTRDKLEQTKDKLEKSRLSSQDHGQRWTSKSEIQCIYCKKSGHHISECRKLQYKNRANVTESETPDTLFLSCQLFE